MQRICASVMQIAPNFLLHRMAEASYKQTYILIQFYF